MEKETLWYRDVTEVLMHGTRFTYTEVRRDDNGMARIVPRTGYEYKGKRYKMGTRWLILEPVKKYPTLVLIEM